MKHGRDELERRIQTWTKNNKNPPKKKADEGLKGKRRERNGRVREKTQLGAEGQEGQTTKKKTNRKSQGRNKSKNNGKGETGERQSEKRWSGLLHCVTKTYSGRQKAHEKTKELAGHIGLE